MEQLQKRKSILKGQITKIVTFARSCDDNTEYDIVKIRVDKLNEHYKDFIEIEDSIFQLDSSTKSDMDTIDENYYSAMGILQKLIRSKINAPLPQFLNSTLNSSVSANMTADFKLPRLSLPTFSGDAREWQSFHDLFKATVHDNIHLTSAQKFQYLKGQLRGQAEKLIRHFPVDDASYLEAFQKLTKRFDRKKLIIGEYIEHFLKHPNLVKVNSESVSRMYDVFDEVIRGLKTLGSNAESRDCWVVHIAESKLDEVSLQLWRQETSENDFPSFDQFLEFLRKRMHTLEGTSSSQSTKFQSKYSNKPSTSKSFLTNFAPNCKLCSGQAHRLFECPKFTEMSIENRRNYLKNDSRCFNCLSETHSVYQCHNKRKCRECGKKHHTLVHPSTSFNKNNQPIQSSPSMQTPILPNQEFQDTLLPTAVVEIQDKFGIWQKCRALLDSASTRSFITESCISRLSLPRSNARVHIRTLNGGKAGSSKGAAALLMRSCYDHCFTMEIHTFIIPKITSRLPSCIIDLSHLPFLNSIPLADPQFNLPGKIDILIGCDKFLSLLTDGQIMECKNQPTAQQTKLGWIVGGSFENVPKNVDVTTLAVPEEINIDQTLRRFWEIEEILPQPFEYSDQEKLCIKHFYTNTRYGNDGRVIVSLPFIDSAPKIGQSYQQALKRFISLEKKLLLNKEAYNDYCTFMTEYEALGHMERIPNDEVECDDEKMFYLPHHGVVKQASSTTKMRVVFDASAKSSTGVSLNNVLLVGPTIQRRLTEILIKQRLHRYIFTADIEKMYRQIWISKNDTNFHRILWRSNPNLPLNHYRLLTVTYGTAPASYLATQTLYKIADDHSHNKSFERAIDIIKNDFYMDDLMSGADTVIEAQELISQINQILQSAGFHLRKWASNDISVLKSIPLNDLELKVIDISENNSMISILGIRYQPSTDTFTFKVDFSESTNLTKRILLSETSKIFDPMGWVSPVTVKIKIIFQKFWLIKLDWDDRLPDEIVSQWVEIRDQLKLLEKINIQRWLHTMSAIKIQLCGFSDASEDAYGAVIYSRVVLDDGIICTNLIASKTKVAPIKTLTIPKLELSAAVLLVRLLNSVTNSLQFSPEIILWCDSTTVLDWITAPPRKGNIFVSNRVNEILLSTSREHWHYIPSKFNPADYSSRGLSPQELIDCQMWWQGPEFLQTNPIINPRNRPNRNKNEVIPKVMNTQPTPESITMTATTKNVKIISSSSNQYAKSTTTEMIITISKYSSFSKMKRILARIYAWLNCAKFNIKNSTNTKVNFILNNSDIQNAEKCLIKMYQNQSFAEEITLLTKNLTLNKRSKLSSFNPFLDNSGILRVGGRLANSSLGYDFKHPILIAGDTHLAQVIVRDAHFFYFHAGPKLMQSIIQQKFHITHSKSLIRRVIHECITCFKQQRHHYEQLMGQLPPARVNLVRPFLQSSVDYAGPYSLKMSNHRGIKTYKAYLVVFTCMGSKALHLELATDLSTDTFIAALKRFQARRGICSEIFSDNATNFIGASKELIKFVKSLESSPISEKIVNWATMNGTKWHFIPPASPNFNGFCEAAVKSTKFHLNRVLGDTILTYEEMYTLLAQIEGVLNSRPLCSLENSNDDFLTPGHFLIGQPIIATPEPDLTHLKMSHLSRWQLTAQLFQRFWRRWQTEYLTTMNNFSKWQRKLQNVKLGDVIFLKDDKLPPGRWKLGRVEEVYPGQDNVVRVVLIKTAEGSYKRPVSKISILPFIDSSDESTSPICLESSSNEDSCNS